MGKQIFIPQTRQEFDRLVKLNPVKFPHPLTQDNFYSLAVQDSEKRLKEIGFTQEEAEDLIEVAYQLRYGYLSNQFNISQEGDKQIIERLIYPRFRGVITFSTLSDIEEIELLDTCSNPSEIARAMREAGDYIFNFKPSEI